MTPEVEIRKMKVATLGTRPGAFLPWHLGKSPLTRRKEVSRAQCGSRLGPGNLTPQTSWVGHSPLSPATPPALYGQTAQPIPALLDAMLQVLVIPGYLCL